MFLIHWPTPLLRTGSGAVSGSVPAQRGLGAALLATGLVIALSPTPPALARQAVTATRGTPEGATGGAARTVTLVTGDQVTVTGLGHGRKTVTVRRPLGAAGAVRTQTSRGDITVVPDEALPYLRAGTLDHRHRPRGRSARRAADSGRARCRVRGEGVRHRHPRRRPPGGVVRRRHDLAGRPPDRSGRLLARHADRAARRRAHLPAGLRPRRQGRSGDPGDHPGGEGAPDQDPGWSTASTMPRTTPSSTRSCGRTRSCSAVASTSSSGRLRIAAASSGAITEK